MPKYGIHKLYLTSTQEHFYFQCPCCSRWTELTWPDCVEIIGETDGQLDKLIEMHCDLGQGYMLARPLPATDVAALQVATRATAHDANAAAHRRTGRDHARLRTRGAVQTPNQVCA